MTSMLPPPYGVAFEFDVVLFDSDGAIVTTPTLAAGDFVLSKGNGATANLTTTPSESPASSGIVRVQLSATEMEADKLTVRWHDASGAEWADGALVIFTAAQTFDAIPAAVLAALKAATYDGLTWEVIQAKLVAALFGNTEDNDTSVKTFLAQDGTTAAFTATIDEDGNRVIDLTP